ncbi:ankyrin repeat and protein kinase domain-containing protein 1-like [Papaver somniferum]|uniref:ankyrin repeat and protein kinase domain-containing protein 1-like n=1 Tax=Papaver somniferum TaxID=3469 RepID=UPI000E702011|nr:ankyrin repeat and protein kinase domain-containing protein 1-like [Papaver somniferum]
MKSRRQAIVSAAASGEVDRLKKLLAKYDDGRGLANTVRNIKDDNGVGIIHFAAVKGYLNVLKYLIEELGLDVNTKDENGKSPLLHATTSGNLNTFEYLLEKGADPESCTSRGYSSMHCAAEKGYTEILTRLLSRGINVNGSSEIGTPLGLAANLGQFEAMKILLDNNANMYDTQYGYFGDPRDPFTKRKSKKQILDFRDSDSVFSRSCSPEAGADPNCGSHGITPLVAAAIGGYTEIIKRLIQAGANPDATDRYGLTPLEITAHNGYRHCVEILFPVTSRITEYTDWNVGGVIRHVHSDQAKEQVDASSLEYPRQL